jgi:hypothetical protein
MERIPNKFPKIDSFTVQCDLFEPFGIPKGSEVSFEPFSGNLEEGGIYLIHIRDMNRYLVIRLKEASLARPLDLGKVSYEWKDLDITGQIIPYDAILDAQFIY